jgi:hypothetical protein
MNTYETSVSVVYDALVTVDVTPDGEYHMRVDLPFYDDGPTVYDANGTMVSNCFLYGSAVEAVSNRLRASYELPYPTPISKDDNE